MFHSFFSLFILYPLPLINYYAFQRATKGGLIICEAVFISPQTIAYNNASGIWLPEQVEGQKKVTNAIHAKGGFAICQLRQVGRQGHDSFSKHPLVKKSGYSTSWTASAVRTEGTGENYTGESVPTTVSKVFTFQMIQELRQDYVKAAKNAITAGFDFVEINAAHGYLLQQFFSVQSNSRDDMYGGTLENRFHLFDEILGDVIGVTDKYRVGVQQRACFQLP